MAAQIKKKFPLKRIATTIVTNIICDPFETFFWTSALT